VAGAGSGRVSGAPLAAGRVAIRICFGNPPNPPFRQPRRTGTARYLAHCYPYMFWQSAKSAIPPAVMQCTALATEPETTGRQFAERLRVCWPVIVCYSGLTAGRMQRSEYRRDHGAYSERNPRGGKLHQGIAAPLPERKWTHRAGAIAGTWPCLTWHHSPRYRTANAPRSCSELASRYQAALSRRIRDSYTIRPVTGSEIGPDCGRHSPRDCGELTP
jgi:hypothetical protein